jgi:hypothetical protein
MSTNSTTSLKLSHTHLNRFYEYEPIIHAYSALNHSFLILLRFHGKKLNAYELWQYIYSNGRKDIKFSRQTTTSFSMAFGQALPLALALTPALTIGQARIRRHIQMQRQIDHSYGSLYAYDLVQRTLRRTLVLDPYLSGIKMTILLWMIIYVVASFDSSSPLV